VQRALAAIGVVDDELALQDPRVLADHRVPGLLVDSCGCEVALHTPSCKLGALSPTSSFNGRLASRYTVMHFGTAPLLNCSE
jgi:hypothetical protein